MPDDQYSIEARSLRVAGVASHDYWVLRGPDGKDMAELHGLATDRETNRAIPIGTDEKKHSLRVWHYVHDKEFAAEHGVKPTRETYIQEGQQHHTVLSGSKEDVLGRWNAAVAAKEPLNALDLNYPKYGFKVFSDTVNSNSAYRTLGEVMGVPVKDFGGVIEPGLDNRMTTPDEIEKLRNKDYPVLSSREPVAPREPEQGQLAQTDAGPATGAGALLAGARDGEAALGTAMRELQASAQGQEFAARAQAQAQAQTVADAGREPDAAQQAAARS